MAILTGVGAFLTKLILPIELLTIICIIGVVAYVVFYYRQFNIEIEIQTERAGFPERDMIDTPGGSIEQERTGLGYYKILHDKGFLKRKKGGYDVLQMMKSGPIGRKKEIKAPPLYYLYPTAKGNKLYLRQIGYQEYIPVLLGEIKDFKGEKVLSFKGEESDVAFWQSNQQQQGRLTYSKKSFMEQYGNMLIFGMCAICVIILIAVVLQKFEVLQNVSANLDHAATALRSVNNAPIQNVGGL
jgi:hypothetical protein